MKGPNPKSLRKADKRNGKRKAKTKMEKAKKEGREKWKKGRTRKVELPHLFNHLTTDYNARTTIVLQLVYY